MSIMKKMAALALAVMMLASFSCAWAEGFTLHKGVCFGMTQDEAIAQEAASGNEFCIGSETRVYSKSKIAILNADDVKVYFTFDENGKLCQQQYIFSTYQYDYKSFKVSALKNLEMSSGGEFAIYNTLGSEFEKVYGKPACSSRDGGALILPGDMSFQEKMFTSSTIASDIHRYISGDDIIAHEISGQLTHPVSDVNYYQWLVDNGDGYVVIEVYGYEYYAKYSGMDKAWVGSDYAVDYRFFTYDEYNALWNEFDSDI